LKKKPVLTLVFPAVLIFIGLFYFIVRQQSYRIPQNLILISVDTLRKDHLGCYGNPDVYTPNIDALSKTCAQFQTCIAPMGRTNPSFASLHTGLYPNENTVVSLFKKLPGSQITIAEILKKTGFKTAFFNSNPMLKPKSGLTQGFDEYYEPTDKSISKVLPVKEMLQNEFSGNEQTPKKIKKKKAWLTHVFDASFDSNSSKPKFQFAAEYVTNAAIKYLKNTNETDKEFLWVHYMDPHWPYEPPSPWNRSHQKTNTTDLHNFSGMAMPIIKFHNTMNTQTRDYLRGLYKSEIEYADYHIGRFLRNLAERHLLENSLIVFVADHGELLGEHNTYFCHGDNVYAENIEVPLMLRAEKQIPEVVLNRLIHITDVMPLILSLLGQENTNTKDTSFAEYIKNPDSSFPDDEIMFSSTGITSKENPRSYFEGMKGRWQTAINKDYKLIYIPHPNTNIWEMYNRSADPAEQINLVGTGLKSEQELRSILEKWIDKNKEKEQINPETLPEDPELLKQLKTLGYID